MCVCVMFYVFQGDYIGFNVYIRLYFLLVLSSLFFSSQSPLMDCIPGQKNIDSV